MKVLLFVEESGRTRFAGLAHGIPGKNGRRWHNLGGTGWHGTCRMTHAMATSRHWWLVECENAAEGRMIIGCAPGDDSRILAQSGAR